MNILNKYFSRRIVIDLYPSQFIYTLQNKDLRLAIDTFLYMEWNESIWTPLAIGQEIARERLSNPNIYRISLFDANDQLPPGITLNLDVLLQLMFEYGIGKCFESFWVPQLRPIVFLLGADRFCSLMEDPGKVFFEAAREAGASLVVFDKTEI